ncbi:MAG: N-acetylglucosamine-6-phosphate deacetylase [Lachnospiraceae bacterium]|nr:N-acetylglucosamine-6-phosphate deacetylase [Lachnospiraceae bacterium]
MWINNGWVFQENGTFAKRDIATRKDKIADTSDDERVIDAENLYVIPGLTDIHFHGCMGYDFCDGTKEALDTITEYQLSRGITTICPASMTYGEERLTAIFQTVANYDNRKGSEIVGINMEGPFISQEKKGAQNPMFIQSPDVNMFIRLQEAAHGMIKLCDLAPELPGAMDFIQRLAKDVQISLAHTDADYETAMGAFHAGVCHVTHLYNGMNPFHHREPGVVGAASDFTDAYVELIGDGIHVSPASVRSTLKMIGEQRLVLISDSLRSCGMSDGQYELGGQAVFKKGKYTTLADGTLAGSSVDLMDVLKTVVLEMNIPLETAITCAAVNSAKSIGIYDTYGSLEKGKRANILLLDRDLNLKYIIKDGVICHRF